MEAPTDVLVIGVGNPDRGDDGVGIAVARRLRELSPAHISIRECRGTATELIHCWQDAHSVIVVDAVATDAPPGEVLRLDLLSQRVPQPASAASTHGFGLAQAVELSRALGRLPEALVLYGVVGLCFDLGAGLSPAVTRAVQEVVEAVIAESANLRLE